MEPLKPRRFGIELELSRKFLCVNNTDRNYSKHWTWLETQLRSLRDESLLQRGWSLKTDTSCGGEVVSPILRGREGLSQVAVICSKIQDYAYKNKVAPIDAECGLHVHFDSADMKPRQLSNLFILLHMAEPIIYSMYPNRNPKYCAPIEINMRLASKFRDWTDVRDTWYRGENNVKNRKHIYTQKFINGDSAGDNYDGTRYHGFNIHCFWRQGTVEFRYGTGTLDPLHIRAYYEMCLSMVNTAMSKKKIRLTTTARDMNHKALVSHVSANYRFRKVIRKLCTDCQFSRGTIKLIMDLVKKNKPYLLAKPPKDGSVVMINANNISNYMFRTPNGYHYMPNGNLVRGNLTELTLQLKVVDCDYDLQTARPDGRLLLFSINPKFKLAYNVRIKSSIYEAMPDTGAVPVAIANFDAPPVATTMNAGL